MPRHQNMTSPTPMDALAPVPLTREDVALRAFDLYQRRGAQEGRDVEDWIEAERQLLEERRGQLAMV